MSLCAIFRYTPVSQTLPIQFTQALLTYYIQALLAYYTQEVLAVQICNNDTGGGDHRIGI